MAVARGGRATPAGILECSGISLKYLGEDLDIHCGGIDNAFPAPHTNEIAQSESYHRSSLGAITGCTCTHLNTATPARCARAKGEFLTVSLLEEKGYDPLCISACSACRATTGAILCCHMVKP